ncbi:MAG: hypothetical protein KGN34_12210 [Sphingomonadales bacterium]|nr:hypothetical protein [Sphingomonadales bacterium]
MEIYWNQFDWQNFCTLAAGGMAVASALYVGLRQAKIAENQLKILSKQTNTTLLGVKIELFERRYRIFDDVRELLLQTVQHACEPDSEVVRKFIVSMHESQFHFKPHVRAFLGEIWDDCCKYFAARNEMTVNYARSGEYGADLIKISSDLFLKIARYLEDLPNIFGDELRLTDD